MEIGTTYLLRVIKYRCGPLDNNTYIIADEAAGEAVLIDPSELELRLECRSYELGWILWSFGQRSDFPELTHNEMFIEPCKK